MSHRLIELRVQGYRRVRAITIRPDGSMVVIGGRNGEGKTSTLNAIWTLLRGKAAELAARRGLAAAPANVIRDGEEECVLYADLGDIKVTRTFRRQESGDETMSLKIERPDGTRITTKQQSFLDELLPKGDLAFDPMDFSRMKDHERYEIMKQCVPDFDFEALARQRKDAFEKRTHANRRRDEEVAAAKAIELPPGEKPKPVDVSGKLDALARAGGTNTSIDKQKEARDRQRERVQHARKRVLELRAEANKLEQQAADEEEVLESLAPLPDYVNVEAIRAELGEAEKVKAACIAFDRKREHENKAEAFEAEANALSTKLVQLDQRKSDAIAAAKLPVEGLTLGDGTVLLNGKPFSLAGTRERLMTAVAIQMRLNPGIKIITIDEGSEIDREGLEILEEMAEAHGFTVIVARVEDDRGYLIEDGMLSRREAAE